MISPEQVESLIKSGLPNATTIEVQDLTGTQDHYQVTIVAPDFAGLSMVKQHQLVYSTVQEPMASGALHALSLKTSAPE